MISNSKGVRPDRPFFAYLPFGATHAPHQAPPAYLDKYRGRFDEGWDVVRQRWYERQIELGVIEPDTELAPRNPGVRGMGRDARGRPPALRAVSRRPLPRSSTTPTTRSAV